MVEEMWSPPSARTRKDLDVGFRSYCRRLAHPSRHISFDASAAVVAADHQPSPFRTSAVPFSWERRPGIPKTSVDLASRSTARRLPLPPPLRPAPAAPQKKRPAAAEDPFAVALVECSKCPSGPSIEELFSRTGSAAVPSSRGESSSSSTSSMSISDRLGLFGLHAVSCKAVCTVVDSAVHIPRPGLRAGNSDGSSYGLHHRRFVRSLSGTENKLPLACNAQRS